MTVLRLNQHRVNRFTKEYKHDVYKRAFNRLTDEMIKDGVKSFNRSGYIKTLHLLIKMIETMPKNYTIQEFEYYEAIMNMTHSMMRVMTIRELKQCYPIEKTYDGARWECKDYYSTMNSLTEYDEDKMIDGDLSDILWDYFNPVIMRVHVNMMLLIDKKNELEGKQGLMEKISQDFQIPLYEKQSDGTFKQIWQKPNLTLVENK